MSKGNKKALIIIPSCVIGVICLLGHSPVQMAQNQVEALRSDFPKLAARYSDKPHKIDYVIVLDRSGSMEAYWDDVKKGLIEFVSAVPTGDDVAIVTFGDVVEGSQDTASGSCNQTLSARNRDITSPEVRITLQQEIGRLCAPAGPDTDMGEALENTLNELYRPEGNRLKIVFFFSDFIHSPPERSKYYSKFSADDPVWTELREQRKKKLDADKKILSYAMLLNTGGRTGQHLNLARVVFPDIISVPINAPTLQGELRRIRAEMTRDNLRQLVEAETALPKLLPGKVYTRGAEMVAVIESDKSGTEQGELLTVKSISNLRIENFQAGELAGHLNPVALSDKTYKLDPASGQVEVTVATINADDIVQQEKNAQVSFDIRATRNLEPADEITKLGLSPSQEIKLQFKPENSISVLLGRYGWWFLILTPVALLLLLVTFIYRRRAEYIVGTFTIRNPQNEPVGTRKFDKKHRRTQFFVGNLTDGRSDKTDFPIENADWLIQFQARKSRMGTRKKRGTYLLVQQGRATLRMGGLKDILKPNDPRKLKPHAKVEAGSYTINFNRNVK